MAGLLAGALPDSGQDMGWIWRLARDGADGGLVGACCPAPASHPASKPRQPNLHDIPSTVFRTHRGWLHSMLLALLARSPVASRMANRHRGS